jgi:site-specific DNA recombinase
MPQENLPAVIPRNGHTLVVGIVARISGCANQKELSLDDQVDHGKEVVRELFDGPVEYRLICTTGKGEQLDRPELAEIEAMIRTRELDLLVAEDLGRLVRGTAACIFCGIAVDQGTRVLAPNDSIDTSEESWEEDVMSACRDHVGHNSHTSKRIKHKKMNRFKKFGGATPCETYGYVKPPGATTYDDWRKDERTAEVFSSWLRMLQETLNCSAVADFLNGRGEPVGPHCRRTIWDGAMVRRITRNSILKGMPGRGFKHTIKHYETGHRISVKNPKGPIFRDHPHLAHWDPDEFDDINARLDEAHKGSGRKHVDGADPRLRVPRKRTRFPGQHAVCWYCGRRSVWGGNGMTDNLMCNGSRHRQCWNSIGYSGAAVGRAVAAAIEAELSGLDGFDDQFREMVERAGREGGAGLAREWADLGRDEAAAESAESNLAAVITAYGPLPMFERKIQELEAGKRERARRRSALRARQEQAPRLPGSVAELRALFAEKFRGLARDSAEFGDLLRLVVPEVHVYLVRLLDGGHPLSQARVRLDLSALVPDARHAPEFENLVTRLLTINLFEPPQRERIREEAVRLTAAGLDQRQVATRLHVTQPVISRALMLDRMMRERGLDTPYVLVTEPPDDYPKLRRHLNPKSVFQPIEGYEPPSL